MKLSHYTTITEGNIALIAFRLKQFIERMGVIGKQSFYLDTTAHIQLFGKSENNVITQSMVSYLSSNDYLLEVERKMGAPFIRINYQSDNGQLLQIGDKIKITSEHVYIHQPFVINDRAYPLQIWKKGDSEACEYQTQTNKHYSDMYWDNVEREYELDL